LISSLCVVVGRQISPKPEQAAIQPAAEIPNEFGAGSGLHTAGSCRANDDVQVLRGLQVASAQAQEGPSLL